MSTRIGNRRQSCSTCNRFARQVDREHARLLRDVVGPERSKTLRETAERNTYAGMVKV